MTNTLTSFSLEDLRNSRDYQQFSGFRKSYYAHKEIRASLDKEIESAELSEPLNGIVAWLQGKHEKASEILSKQNEEFYLLLAAESEFCLENWETALTISKKISDSEPFKIEARRLTIEALIGLKRLEEARETLSSFPNGTSHFHYCQGLVCDAEHKYEESLDHYEQAIAQDPHHRHALFRAAVIQDRYGNDEEAIQLYEKCREITPVILSGLINLGILYEDAGRYQDAVYCFEEILDIDPNHERAKLFLNDIRQSFNMTYDEEAERLRDQQQKLLQTNIADFELSVRSRNCLQLMNIHTLGDLVQKSEQELLSYPNFGDTSLLEIKEILKAKQIRLGQSIKPGALSKDLEGRHLEESQDPKLKTPISALKFSIRSSKVLESLGVATVGELTQFSEEQLLAQKNFGKTSIKEINNKLLELGYQLKSASKKERVRPEIAIQHKAEENIDQQANPLQKISSTTPSAGINFVPPTPGIIRKDAPHVSSSEGSDS